MRKFAILLMLALAPLFTVSAAADRQYVGNNFFEVTVEDAPGADGVGTFAIRTGSQHPAGAGYPVLFTGAGGGDAGSSYLTVRSYTTGTDYVQTATGAGSAFLVASLDPFGTVEAIGTSGYRTTYLLPGGSATPDTMRITSEIEATGSSTSGASVALRASITNEGSIPVEIGVRYLLDFANGGDDGPAWREAGEPPRTTEGSRGTESASMTLSPTSLVAAPVTIAVGTSPAGPAAFASWTHAFPFAFDYTTAGRDIAGPCSVNDSALLTYVGRDQGSAVLLGAGESISVSVSLAIGDNAGFESDSPTACATPVPTPTVPPGQPAPPPEPVELPRTGRS